MACEIPSQLEDRTQEFEHTDLQAEIGSFNIASVFLAAACCNVVYDLKPILISKKSQKLVRDWSKDLEDGEPEPGSEVVRDNTEEGKSSEGEKQSNEDEERSGADKDRDYEDEERGSQVEEKVTGEVTPVTGRDAKRLEYNEPEITGGIIDSGARMKRTIVFDGVCPGVIKQAKFDFTIDLTKAKQAPKHTSTFIKLEGKELQVTCVSALKLLRSLDTNDHVSQCREQFVRKIFSTFSDETYQQLQEQAAKRMEQSPGLSLSCEVIRGNLLHRDSKDVSKVYIMLGIIPQGEALEGRKAHQMCLATMKEESVVKETFTTAATLSMTWNESFELEMPNGLKGCLLLEARLEDEARKSPTKTKIVKGIGNFLGMKKDNFIGNAVLPLKDIGMVGGQMTLELFPQASKKPKGTITLKLNIHGNKERDQAALQEYHKLLHTVIAHESRENNGRQVKHWNGQLSDEAMSFISAYSSVHCLTVLEQNAKLLSILMEYHLTHKCVEMTEFQKLVTQIQTEGIVPNQQISETDASSWVTHLLDDLKELWTCIMEFISSHVMQADFGESNILNDLESSLSMLKSLHSIEIFTAQRLAQEEKQFHHVLCHCIQTSVSTYFGILTARVAEIKGDDERTKGLTHLCEHYLDMFENLCHNLQPIFLKFDVDFYSLVFVSFEELLEHEIKQYLAPSHELVASVTYEMYLTLNKFLPLADGVNPSVINPKKKKLAFHSCHCWFDQHVNTWVEFAKEEAQRMAERLIAQDVDADETDSVSYLPPSAILIDSIFQKVASFWECLCWPDKVQACQHCIAVVQILCQVAKYYASTVGTCIGKELACDSHGKLHLSQKVCLLLNGIEHVYSLLKSISERFEMDSFWLWLESEDSTIASSQEETQRLSKTTRVKFDELVTSTGHQMLSLQAQEINKVLSPKISLHFSGIIGNNSSTGKAMDPLVQYFTENMRSLKKQLSNSLFFSILEDLWLIVLQELRKHKSSLSQTKSQSMSSSAYQNLHGMLDLLRQLFHAEGNGLTYQQLCNKDYADLLSDIQLATMAADQLAVQFLIDLSSEQLDDPTTLLGTLHFSHLYVEGDQRLEVNVLFAENLISDKIDSYVELVLLPAKHFPNIKPRMTKTSVQKLTRNPTFNESFKLPVKKHLLAESASVLLLVVHKKIFMGKDEFLGMCVISCGNIPIGGERKVEHLPLFQFSDIGSKPFRELQGRKKSEAVKLCNLMKLLVVPRKYFHCP